MISIFFQEDSSISIGDINIPHQVSIVADNTTKSIRAAYVDLKSDQLGRALGLSQPHLDIKVNAFKITIKVNSFISSFFSRLSPYFQTLVTRCRKWCYLMDRKLLLVSTRNIIPIQGIIFILWRNCLYEVTIIEKHFIFVGILVLFVLNNPILDEAKNKLFWEKLNTIQC